MKKKIFCLLSALLLMVQAMPVMAAEEDTMLVDNYLYTFTDIDGTEVTTQSSGKPKLVVFFMEGCLNCKNTLGEIASSEWLKNGEVDVCAIEFQRATIDKVKKFQADNCPGSTIQFVADDTYMAQNAAYAYQALTTSADVTTPWVVMIDKENKIQAISKGYISASGIEKYLPVLKGETGTTPPSNPDDSQNPDTPGNPDDGQNPDTPGNPDDGQNPDTPGNPDDSQNPGTPEQPDETPDTSSGNTACNHVGESNVISQATATSDALVAVECVKCGVVFRYETVSNSAYAAFLKETTNAILNAEQNGEAVVNTKIWTSFNKAVFEAMKSRPDVKVTVNYVYQGNPYVLNIPAKVNVDSLMDENGFGGFRFMEQVLSAK